MFTFTFLSKHCRYIYSTCTGGTVTTKPTAHLQPFQTTLLTETPGRQIMSQEISHLHPSFGGQQVWLYHRSACGCCLLGKAPKGPLEPNLLCIYLKRPIPHLESPNNSNKKAKYNSNIIMRLWEKGGEITNKKLNLLRRNPDFKQSRFFSQGTDWWWRLSICLVLPPQPAASLSPAQRQSTQLCLPASYSQKALVQNSAEVYFLSSNTSCNRVFCIFPCWSPIERPHS